MKKGLILCAFLSVPAILTICACKGSKTAYADVNDKEVAMTLKVTSPAFTNGGAIPTVYSCDSDDISPQIDWTAGPEGTKSYVLICHDPDAPVGDWVHWVMYNIPADVTNIPQNVPSEDVLENGAVHGKNSWGNHEYGGPCPPGGTHRYFFKIFALDTLPDEEPGMTRKEVENAMEDHILAQGELMGTYAR